MSKRSKSKRQCKPTRLSYQALESRRLLAADFSFSGTTLTLNNFVDSTDAPNRVVVRELGESLYTFTLQDGDWNNTGSSVYGADVFDGNRLFVDTGFVAVSRIVIDSTTSDQFGIDFDSFGFSGDLTISKSTGVEFSDVSQIPDATFGISRDLEITGVADINLDNRLGSRRFGNSFRSSNIDIQNADSISLAAITDIDVANISASGDVDVDLFSISNITVQDVTASGAVGVRAFGDLQLGTVTAGTSIDITTIGGGITVGSTSGGGLTSDGDILLDANGVDGHVFVNGTIATSGGVVDVNAEGNVEFSADGVVTTSGGEVTVAAEFDADGRGAITMADGAVVDAGTGAITFQADDDIVLGGLTTSSGSISLRTNGDVLDGGDAHTDILAPNSIVLIDAGGSLGSGSLVDVFQVDVSNFIEISTRYLFASAVRGAAIELLNPNTDAQVSGQAVTLSTPGDFVFTDPTPTTSNLVFFVAGTLTLPNKLTLAGDLRIDAADVDAADGSIDLVVDRLLFKSASTLPEVLMTEVNQLDVQSAGDLTVTNLGNLDLVDFDSDGISAQSLSGDLVVSATAGPFFSGDLDIVDEVIASSGSISLTASRNLDVEQVQASVDVTLDARVRITADSVTAGNLVSANAGAFLSTENVEARDVVLIAGTNQIANRVIADIAELRAEGNLGVNDIQVPDLTIEAGNRIFDTQWRDGLGIKSDALVVRAGNETNAAGLNGIVLETEVNELSAYVDGQTRGGILIREFDDLILADVEIESGVINIQANGAISDGSVRTRTSSSDNLVLLRAIGSQSDISVGQIDVGRAGRVNLIAGDDVLSAVGGVEEIIANDLFVSAQNQSSGATDGIALATDVTSARLVVGQTGELNPRSGDIAFSNANRLVVSFARTLNGKVDISADGDLLARNVNATGVSDVDSIRLTASGEGADVIPSRVAVVGRTGGIVLTADDDVRHANLSNFGIVADHLTVTAGNNLDDAFDGINLQESRIFSVDASVLQGEAVIAIRNTGGLTVNSASLDAGSVNIVNQGYLKALDVAFANLSNRNGVSLVTTGAASTISVGQITTGNGPISLDSANDISDTDSSDDQLITGTFLQAIARNGRVDTFDGITLTVDVNSFVADALGSDNVFVTQI